MYTTTSSFLFTLLAGSAHFASTVSAVPTPKFMPPASKIIPANTKNSFAFPAAAAELAARAVASPNNSQAARQLAKRIFPVAVKNAAKKAKRQTVERAAELIAESSPRSTLDQIQYLFDPQNRWFPATIAVTCVAAFLLSLAIIWTLQKIAHLPRFADSEEPLIDEKQSHSRFGSDQFPVYNQPVVPELRVSTSPDSSMCHEKGKLSKDLLLPPGSYYGPTLPQYSAEDTTSANVNRPPPAARSPRRHRSIISPSSYRVAGRSARHQRKGQQAGLGVGQPQGAQGRKTYARVLTA